MRVPTGSRHEIAGRGDNERVPTAVKQSDGTSCKTSCRFEVLLWKSKKKYLKNGEGKENKKEIKGDKCFPLNNAGVGMDNDDNDDDDHDDENLKEEEEKKKETATHGCPRNNDNADVVKEGDDDDDNDDHVGNLNKTKTNKTKTKERQNTKGNKWSSS